MKKIQKYALLGVSLVLLGIVVLNWPSAGVLPPEGCPAGWYEDVYGNCVDPANSQVVYTDPGGHIVTVDPGERIDRKFSITDSGSVSILILIGLAGLLILYRRRT